jgi:hypothetical protein
VQAPCACCKRLTRLFGKFRAAPSFRFADDKSPDLISRTPQFLTVRMIAHVQRVPLSNALFTFWGAELTLLAAGTRREFGNLDDGLGLGPSEERPEGCS